MRIALIGTRGVPARYGGFETAVEEVGRRLVQRGHEVIVYCRAADHDQQDGAVQLDEFLGMRLVHLPAMRKRSLETLSHTGLSVLHRSLRGTDAAIVFNAANAPLLPVIRARGIPVATHVDGLEWKRAKWGTVGQRYYKMAESLAVRWSDALIADAQGIVDHYRETFSVGTSLITYGAPILRDVSDDRLEELSLSRGGYHLVVARFEPENHVREIVEGYRQSAARLPLVVVGSAPYSDDYTASIHAAADDRVRFLGGIWDQDQLNQLYAHAVTYLHGHSVGGTNPSLLRAMGTGTFTIAFDVNFNREVVGEHAAYFRTSAEVAAAVDSAESDRADVENRGELIRSEAHRYNWDDVAQRYEALCRNLAQGLGNLDPIEPSRQIAATTVR